MRIDKTNGINRNKDKSEVFQELKQDEFASIFVKDSSVKKDDKVSENILDATFNQTEGKETTEFTELPDKTGKWSNIWTVQNNQSVVQIAIMILKQTKPNYDKTDVDKMTEELLRINKSKLDGTKKGFLVNSKIKLPVEIDISKEKQSENPVYDYVWGTQSKRVNEIVKRYNLVNNDNIKTPTLNDAIQLSNEFIKRYGFLDSSSRENLILSPHFKYKEQTAKNIKAVRQDTKYGPATSRITKVDKNVKKYRTANCGECSNLLTKMGLYKFNDKYDISELEFNLYFDDYKLDRKREHIAMLMKSKDGKEEYVIDPWIAPKMGGVFKREDWEIMIKELYRVKDSEIANFDESYTNIEELSKEKIFFDNAKGIEKEIPQKYLDSITNFVNYVSLEIRKGKTFSKKVMQLFMNYGGSYYTEIFDEQKDFYSKRNLIIKEVSEKASVFTNDFGKELLERLADGEKFSKEIMTLFRKYCPEKYKAYLKSEEIKKHSDTIKKVFPDCNINDFIKNWELFADAVTKGLDNKENFPKEIIDLYLKCNQYASRQLRVYDTNSRIKKTDNDYYTFEKDFYKEFSPEKLQNYLNNITDYPAALVTMEKIYEKLITEIDNKKYGWGNGKGKKALIMPLVNFIAKACSNLPKEEINSFKQTCIKELDATFYTNEKKIISAFEQILSKANYYYKNAEHFDYILWLENKTEKF